MEKLGFIKLTLVNPREYSGPGLRQHWLNEVLVYKSEKVNKIH